MKLINGRDEQVLTDDHLTSSEVRYQLALNPEIGLILYKRTFLFS